MPPTTSWYEHCWMLYRRCINTAVNTIGISITFGSPLILHRSSCVPLPQVRTQTLVKNAIIQIDASPFKTWYHSHYGVEVGIKKRGATAEAAEKEEVKRSNHAARKYKLRLASRKLDQVCVRDENVERVNGRLLIAMSVYTIARTQVHPPPSTQHLDDQFAVGRLYACISSRPGQCGRCDGYILEGKELEFYLKKMQKKKGKA